jgi:hypothetical protein
MKYVLAAMCGLVVLFMGGCAVMLLAQGPFALIPAAIGFLNLAILGALFGWQVQWRPAFYVLGCGDLVFAAGCAWIAVAGTPGAWPVAGLFALKGILSFVYAARSPPGQAMARSR